MHEITVPRQWMQPVWCVYIYFFQDRFLRCLMSTKIVIHYWTWCCIITQWHLPKFVSRETSEENQTRILSQRRRPPRAGRKQSAAAWTPAPQISPPSLLPTGLNRMRWASGRPHSTLLLRHGEKWRIITLATGPLVVCARRVEQLLLKERRLHHRL